MSLALPPVLVTGLVFSIAAGLSVGAILALASLAVLATLAIGSCEP